ncbi:prepilin-type N-terminal cleavage/methylation domain-containing protein [Oceanobacillus limi]|uniref:Prepilin-type N-terminal cleavage/methylation domain-containing protein n=1 Tax=Oceanobacillus limi TaxID=930131 RepID=A0A1I0EKQ6_9BACI|nr:type II secretion system protein [Oceanobacillus limi]SET45090.1 prepilin-type N-terminal cleavage/methylation domain-containing protein [Oceanobacillus limi]
MLIKKWIVNRDGFTLIEIIASIALLSMVIAIFLPIFPQIINWTNQSEGQLKSGNLMDQVIFDLENHSNIHTNFNTSCPAMSDPFDVRNISNEFIYLEGYYPVIRGCKEEELDLYRTQIQIHQTDDPGRIFSDTYIYLEGELDE